MASTVIRPSLAHRSKRASLAIIDDYLGTSAAHFAHIPRSKLQTTVFRETIVPRNNTKREELIDRLSPFELIATMRERTAFPRSILERLPNLKVLLATGTQFETFDLACASELGIAVVAAPGLGRKTALSSSRQTRQDIKAGGAHPTTQHTWALIMALARNVAIDDAALKSGNAWQSGLATGLTGLTIGIVGLGRLGAAVARIAHLAWNMRVICWSANLTQAKADIMAASVGLPIEDGNGEKTFRVVTKEELFSQADVVSLHYVLSDRSRGLVGAQELAYMMPSALLINTSRGALIDEQALLQALLKGSIRGAALDVFEVEPLEYSSPWRKSNY
ncbi:Hypothetical protein R9X50_00768400 [Acrodontium crateriforme]|uniref:Uncharacterized protein n=1 Tax=Acrodontium crateriforme TaxID=150365 RepID=A0AAQ3MC59_9PEZI|nr:Hypothetical protein R9X50_00768400 [Acrodontium crateriforme]